MISKKNIWYLTMFSILLVLAVYYVSFSSPKEVKVSNDKSNETKLTIKESENLTALRVSRDEELEKQMSEVKKILNDESTNTDEKNDAYEALKKLTTNKGKSTSLETLINQTFKLDSFVSVDNNKVKIVVDNKKHSYELANKIINLVQKEFDNKMYITVSFK